MSSSAISSSSSSYTSSSSSSTFSLVTSTPLEKGDDTDESLPSSSSPMSIFCPKTVSYIDKISMYHLTNCAKIIVSLKFKERRSTEDILKDMSSDMGTKSYQFIGNDGESYELVLSLFQTTVQKEIIKASTTASPLIASYSSMSSSSSTSSSLASTSLEEISYDFECVGLEKVFKGYTPRQIDSGVLEQIPALIFQFKHTIDAQEFFFATKFNESVIKGGRLYEDLQLGPNHMKFEAASGQSHEQLLSLIQTALKESSK